jgi:hypothetical protein
LFVLLAHLVFPVFRPFIEAAGFLVGVVVGVALIGVVILI